MGKFLIHGGYYSRNFGDFVLIDKTIKTIKSAEPKSEIGLAMAPKSVREEFKGLNDLSILNIARVDKVVFTGGGYLGERDYKVMLWSVLCIYRQVFLPLLCIIFRKPFAYFGVEVGPLRHKFLRKMVGFVLDRSDVVMVRNKFSYDFCKMIMKNHHKLILATDFAQNKDFLLGYSKDVDFVDEFTKNKKIGIHVTKYLAEYDSYKDSLVSFLNEKVDEGFELVFFTDSPAHDQLINSKEFLFFEYFKSGSFNFISYNGPEFTTCLISSFDVVVTSKLHVGIIGLTCGAIPISLPSHNKTVRYYEQVNLSDLCLYKKESSDILKTIEKVKSLLDGGIHISVPEDNLKKERLISARLIDFVKDK